MTLVGQKFLHTLREELVAGFLKSFVLLSSLAGVMVNLLVEGRRFSLGKLGQEDSNGESDLEVLLSIFSSPVAALGIDDSLSADHPWWILALGKAACVFISSSWDDPQYLAWRELLYSVALFPEELLRFTESKLSPPSEPCLWLPASSSDLPAAASNPSFLLDEPQWILPPSNLSVPLYPPSMDLLLWLLLVSPLMILLLTALWCPLHLPRKPPLILIPDRAFFSDV